MDGDCRRGGVAPRSSPLMDEEEEKLPVVPLGDRKLRACLVTGLVKTEDQVCAAPQLPTEGGLSSDM